MFDLFFADTGANDMQSFLEKLADRSLTIAFLAFAIYFIGRRLIASETAKDTLMKERIAQLEKDSVELRKRVDDCEDDRAEIHRKLREQNIDIQRRPL